MHNRHADEKREDGSDSEDTLLDFARPNATSQEHNAQAQSWKRVEARTLRMEDRVADTYNGTLKICAAADNQANDTDPEPNGEPHPFNSRTRGWSPRF